MAKTKLATSRKADLRERIKLAVTKYWQLYLLLLLPVVYILIFNYYPMLGIQIAFKKFLPREGIWGGTWVGLAYFKKLFSTYSFLEILRNTLVISLYMVVANIPVPTALALALNSVRNKAYKKTVQMVTYMPHFISIVVIVSLLMQILNPRIGMAAFVLEKIGVEMPDLFASPTVFPHLYVWSDIWQNAGWNSIIYLAALSRVDVEQHESAIVNGATRFQRIIYIDLPAILPTIAIIFILNSGKVMSIGFEKAFLMQNALNISASEIISTYTYKIGLTGYADYSYATAIGLFNSLINLVLILIADKLSKRISDSGLF